jgi:transcriptional regulator with XRE-family HTH domain
MENFTKWLERQIQDRGWSIPETARRSKKGGYEGVSDSMIYKVLNNHANPGLKFFEGIARAFDMPKEEVMRIAGELNPQPEETAELKEALHLLAQLSPEQRRYVLTTIRALATGTPAPASRSS